jgi:hypothetical protein
VEGKKIKYIVGGNGIFEAKMDRGKVLYIEKEVAQCEVRSEKTKITGGFRVSLVNK